MFGASETRYDLRFQALGIPVRIHPLFWVVSFILGFHDAEPNNIPLALLFVVCSFLSILVHEFGHGLVAKAQGYRPSEILLYFFGGLCSYDPGRQRPGQHLAVLIWGPGAGFVLAGVVMLAYSAAFGLTAEEHLAVVKRFLGQKTDLTSVLDKLGYVFRRNASICGSSSTGTCSGSTSCGGCSTSSPSGRSTAARSP